MSKIFPIAAGFAIGVALAAGLYYSVRLPPDAPAPPVPAASSSEPTAGLTLLEEPRAMPKLRFANGAGAAMSLADFRGRVVLLNIWATWCVPCRKEMPTLDRLQEKLGGSQFEVVVLSIDQGGAAAVQSFYGDIGVRRLGVYVDTSGKVARDLNIVGLPTTLLIDREGRERARLIGPAVWDSPEIVSAIKSVVDAPPASQSGLERFPQRVAARSDAASSLSSAHGNVKRLVSISRLTFWRVERLRHHSWK